MVKYDTRQTGLETVFKPYQVALLEYIWEKNGNERTGTNSGQAYRWLSAHPDKKSRASVIFFLNDLVDEGVLEYEEKSGKGGYHRVYFPKMTREQFGEYVIKELVQSLHQVFPEVAEKVLG